MPQVMFAVRYVLPAVLAVAAIVLVCVEPNSRGLEGGAMMMGAAMSVLLLNVLVRAGFSGDREREDEEAAREHFARTGRWPDEPEP